MDSSIASLILGVGLLALYQYVEVPEGYRRWAFLALLLALPIVCGSPVRDTRLALFGVRTTGVVVEQHCGAGKSRDAVTLSYVFKADGVAITGSGRSGQGNPNCGIAVGDPVHVSYLPAEPVVNAAVKNPLLALAQSMLIWFAVCLFMTWIKSAQAARVKEFFS